MSFPSSPMDISFYQQLQLSPPASPTQGHHPAALCYYPAAYPSPPPFATDDGFHHIPEAHAAVMTDNPSPPPPLPPPKADGGERVVVARKDRHSKICTAGGMRDRRMRLSLDVARRFFALQDKLGFDKASKTVQWLLDMSRAGIKELMMTEDGSSLSDTTKQHDVEQQIVMDSDSDRKKRPIKASKRAAAAPKKSNASSPISTIDKESRARARERARERTKERSRLRWATLASSISIEEAPPPPPPSSRHLNMASQVEDVIPAFEDSSYCHQDQWELSGVVFAKAHFH